MGSSLLVAAQPSQIFANNLAITSSSSLLGALTNPRPAVQNHTNHYESAPVVGDFFRALSPEQQMTTGWQTTAIAQKLNQQPNADRFLIKLPKKSGEKLDSASPVKTESTTSDEHTPEKLVTISRYFFTILKDVFALEAADVESAIQTFAQGLLEQVASEPMLKILAQNLLGFLKVHAPDKMIEAQQAVKIAKMILSAVKNNVAAEVIVEACQKIKTEGTVKTSNEMSLEDFRTAATESKQIALGRSKHSDKQVLTPQLRLHVKSQRLHGDIRGDGMTLALVFHVSNLSVAEQQNVFSENFAVFFNGQRIQNLKQTVDGVVPQYEIQIPLENGITDVDENGHARIEIFANGKLWDYRVPVTNLNRIGF